MSNRLAFSVVGLATLFAYVATASRWLGLADSPEFAALYALGGVAHPPGYPTVVVAYRLFAWLPVAPAHGASIAAACYGALTVVLLCNAAVAWGATRNAAVAASVLVAFSSQVWLHHTAPEAFAIANVFGAAILWLSAPDAPVTGTRRAAALGLLAGLALGAHHSLVLLAPIGLYAVFDAARGAAHTLRTWVAAAVAFGCGISIYGYCLIADSPVGLGRANNLTDLMDLFLRREYGTTRLGVEGAPQPLEHFLLFATETAADLGFIGAGFLVAGLVIAARAVPVAATGRRALFASWCLIGPLFVLLFNTVPDGPQAEIARRFHALPMIVGTPLIAMGIDGLLDRDALSPLAKRAVLIATFVLVFGTGYTRVSRLHQPTLENYLRNTLQQLPQDAVLFADGDHRLFGFQYLQHVEGIRQDVVLVNPGSLARPWLIDELGESLGFELPELEQRPDGTNRFDLNLVVDTLLAGTRPIYVIPPAAPTVFDARPSVPDGVAWRLLRTDEVRPSPAALVRRTQVVFEQFEHQGAAPEYAHEPWAWTAYNTWTLIWSDLHKRCVEANDPCEAAASSMLEKHPDL